MNSRLTPKEWNLVKGALRRVFSRSELRRKVVDKTIVKGHVDDSRKRVKTWCKCSGCGAFTPKSYMEVDHRLPVVPLDKSLMDMSLEELVNNLWCDENNLAAICETCHDEKTKQEAKIRASNRKKRKEINGTSSKRKASKKTT